MDSKEKFQEAIIHLVERNQSYVNRKGINAYSKAMDRIINDLIRFYNDSQIQDPYLDTAEKDYVIVKLQDEIDRLETIFRIFNINPDQFKYMDKAFLDLKLKKGINEDEIFCLPPIYFMNLETEWMNVSTTIRSMIHFVTSYKRALSDNIESLIQFYQGKQFKYLEKYMKAIKEYPNFSDKSIERWISIDYYNGTIKKNIDQEAE